MSEPCLTGMQLRVLKLIALGYENKQIAVLLVVAESTVRNHISQLYPKLGVRNRVQAAICAYRRNIVTLDEAWEASITLKREAVP